MATEWISRDSIVAALDMCAVLAHYDIRAGRGTSFRIHCPFHEDDRPSCSINPGAKVFNCFACGEQGNVLDFIAGMEDLDPKAEFRAVLEKAIEIIGHNPTPQKGKRSMSTGIAGRSKQKVKSDNDLSKTGSRDGSDINGNSNYDSHNADADPDGFGSSQGKDAPNTPKKSKKRSRPKRSNEPDGSLDLEPNRVLEGPAFPLKLKDKHSWLDAQLKRIGVNRSVAAEFGIGFEGRSNALMANRVCFPIHNGEGDLVAYAGRWASDEADDQGRFFNENGREQPRYRLPKGFHKQLELFNWHRVLEQFEDTATVVLVEGFWSVLRLQAMTIPSVALMGLSISDAQIRLLLDGGIRSVIVMLDGDDEGQAAMETIVPRLASHFFTRSIILRDGIKPDDVDLSVLNEVRALCADLVPKTDAKPSADASHRKKTKKKLSNKTDTAASKNTLNGQHRDQSDEASKKPKRDYALPPSSATASFGWTAFE